MIANWFFIPYIIANTIPDIFKGFTIDNILWGNIGIFLDSYDWNGQFSLLSGIIKLHQ